jgi:hypothetical protein
MPLTDQWFVTEIDQHGIVLIVEPMAEDIETAVWRPRGCVVEPARQLLNEDLLARHAVRQRPPEVCRILGSSRSPAPGPVPVRSVQS